MVKTHVLKLLAINAFMILHRFDDSSLLLRGNVTVSVQNLSAILFMLLDLYWQLAPHDL
jgi:hypothetical protein